MVKNQPACAGEVRYSHLIPGQEDSLEEDLKTHSSIPGWRNPWTDEPGGLQSTGSQRSTTEVT